MGEEVLVVGAGPVGLTMACALRRHGVECRIVDEREGPTPARESRALGIQARTMEVFEDLGLASAVLDRGRRVLGGSIYDCGRRFAQFAFDFDELGTPYLFALVHPQGETERRLIEALEKLGGSVERRTRLTGLRQDDGGVTATLADAGGGTREVRAGWLVGCDGAHSAVRHQLGLSFEGIRYEEKFLLADLRLSWDLSPDEIHLLFAPGAPVPAFPLPEPGHWRLIDISGAVETDDPGAITDRFRELLRQNGLPSARIDETIWTSSFRISRRAVERIRVGRCFLAGDAAHIHSPVGGQGMNTGIQDAYNLAWKLASVIRGDSPESLLDSYYAERHPVATEVLRGTDRATWAVTHIATLRSSLARAVRNRVMGVLAGTGFFRRRVTRGISELGVNYRGSPIVAEDRPGGGSWAGLRPGDRVPDVELATASDGPRRLFDVIYGARHTLLLFDGSDDSPAAGPGAFEAVIDLVRRRLGDRIRIHRIVKPGVEPKEAGAGGIPAILDPDGRLHRRFDARSASLYLIRPDGYVGYRSQPPDADRLGAYLVRLFV